MFTFPTFFSNVFWSNIGKFDHSKPVKEFNFSFTSININIDRFPIPYHISYDRDILAINVLNDEKSEFWFYLYLYEELFDLKEKFT